MSERNKRAEKRDDYLNDPDLVNEPMPLREIHAIRLMLDDEMKDMTQEERVACINDRTGTIMQRFGLSRLRASNEGKDKKAV